MRKIGSAIHLITTRYRDAGCDTGFGLTLAKHLHSLGFQVFAGCLLKTARGDGAKQLLQVRSNRMHVLQLDVTKEEEWDEAIKYVKEKTGGELWGVVSNAG